MTTTLIPNADDQRIADQLALAKQLRDSSMTDKGGSGMAGNVYMVGNQYGNLAKGLGGTLMDFMGNREQKGLENSRNQQYEDYMKQLPQATTQQTTQQTSLGTIPGSQQSQMLADQQGEGPLPEQSVTQTIAKPTRQYQQEMNQFALNAPNIPQFQAFRQAGAAQALAAPEKQAAAEEAAAVRKADALQKSTDALALQKEREFWQGEQNKQFKLTYDQQLALRQAPTIHITNSGSGKAADSVNQDAADFIASRYLEGDKAALTGISRNKELHTAVMGSIARQAKDQGIDAKEAVQRGLEYTGANAEQRTMGTQAANVAMAANEANKMIDVSSDLSKKVSRTDFPAINNAGNIIAKQSGDPNVVAFNQSIDSLINGYARAINPRGVATVADKKAAHEKLNAAFSTGQFDATVGVMRREMNAALAAPKEARAQSREARVGGSEAGGSKTVNFSDLK